MTTLIGIPLKKTNEIDLVKPLKNLFSSYCISADEPVHYDDALTELNKARLNSTWRTLDKHENSLEIMMRYYDQITSLEAKCPATEFPVPFKWKDAFDKGSFFGGTASLTISTLAYERICILFNIAAMQSQIACGHATDIRNDEGLKLAAKYFQLSSGTFQHVKSMLPMMGQDPTPDLQPDTLLALQYLMVAQAQECFFYKALADNMKDAIIAKIAAQCDELFGDTLKQMHKDSTRVLWDKEWLLTISGKQIGFSAVSQHYQSLVCKAAKNVGEEIARLQNALELLRLAEVRGGTAYGSFKEYVNKINYEYETAKKDNDFIYHARVPDIKSLPPIGKAALAKPTPVPEKLCPNAPDLFAELLPMSVQRALQTFDTRKIEIISQERAKIQNSTQMINGILASLNLPAALEDDTGCSLPASLRDKADAILDKGGIETLEQNINEMPDLRKRNDEILQECEDMLQEEEECDRKLRDQFKDKWTRTPSGKLNESLKQNIRNFKDVMATAGRSDEVVRTKLATHRDKIKLLCCPEDELLSHVPKGSPTSNSSAAEELKSLMAQVKMLLDERNSLKDELEGSTTDMKMKFMNALSQDGSINEQAISVETLGSVYGPIQKGIQENISRQEKLIAEIQRVNAEFCKVKPAMSNRESILSELAAAHDAFMEISDNLREGVKFYNDFTQVLVAFQNKISDFCFARKTERDETSKELQKSIISEANKQTVPTAPAHHSQQVKPTRPPPPKAVTPAPAPIPNVQPQAPYAYPGPAPPTAAAGAPDAGYQPNPNVPYPMQPVFPYPYAPQYYQYPPAMPPQQYPPQGGYPPQPQPGQYQGYPPQQYHQYYPPQ